MGFFSDLGKALSGGGDTRRAEDKAAKEPSYSASSVKGLTSSDPANVARNQAAAKMYAEQAASRPESKDQKEREKKPSSAADTSPPAPVTPPPTLTPPGAPAPVGTEGPTSAADAAAMESTRGGRASTILTSALGLLADQEAQGLLRPRRSLMSGGMIK